LKCVFYKIAWFSFRVPFKMRVTPQLHYGLDKHELIAVSKL